MNAPNVRSVLVTGAGGYIGGEVVRRLGQQRERYGHMVALDVRLPPVERRAPGVEYVEKDIRDTALVDVLCSRGINCVVHLASIVNPGGPGRRDFEHSVDVLGTRNVVEASLAAGVDHLIVTSSGAAYGYHADNPLPLAETDALRGNPQFAYSDHKRQVEEMLAQYRQARPELRQLVFRPGTVLGAGTRNQITRLFERSWVLGVRGSAAPFVFIWDQDVVRCIVRGIEEQREGIYNLAGDGTVTLREIARQLGRPYIALPAWLIKAALSMLAPLGASPYGPEQVMFLQYRPVLGNQRLKEEFGFEPTMTSAEVFCYYLEHRQAP